MTRFHNGSYDRTYKDGPGREEMIDGPTEEDLAPLGKYNIDTAVEAKRKSFFSKFSLLAMRVLHLAK